MAPFGKRSRGMAIFQNGQHDWFRAEKTFCKQNWFSTKTQVVGHAVFCTLRCRTLYILCACARFVWGKKQLTILNGFQSDFCVYIVTVALSQCIRCAHETNSPIEAQVFLRTLVCVASAGSMSSFIIRFSENSTIVNFLFSTLWPSL